MNRRILIITPGFLPLLGGMEEQCYLIGKEFIARGYAVDVFTEQTELNFLRKERLEEIRIYRVAYGLTRNWWLYLRLSVYMIVFLLLHRQAYDLIIIRTFTFPSLLIGLIKRLKILNRPTFLTADTGGEGDELLMVRGIRWQKIVVWLLNAHNHLNSITASNKRNMLALGLDSSRFTNLYNGFDISPFETAIYPDHVTTFLFLGRLQVEKGVHELLSAFILLQNRHPKIRLLIGGDGPEKIYLRKRIMEAGLDDKIQLLGRIHRSNKADFFRSGECLVLPSYSEGFPLVIGEAAIYKRLIIATDVSDLKMVYGTSITFCEKRSIDDLHRAMAAVMHEAPVRTYKYDAIIKILDIRNLVTSLIQFTD